MLSRVPLKFFCLIIAWSRTRWWLSCLSAISFCCALRSLFFIHLMNRRCLSNARLFHCSLKTSTFNEPKCSRWRKKLLQPHWIHQSDVSHDHGHYVLHPLLLPHFLRAFYLNNNHIITTILRTYKLSRFNPFPHLSLAPFWQYFLILISNPTNFCFSWQVGLTVY